jgi:hypothetical protein
MNWFPKHCASNNVQQPGEPLNPEQYEYRFRKAGDVILFCVYYIGANGGYCTKNGPKYVTRTDQAAAQWCRENPNSDPPHAVYGEAGDLDYRCKGSRMTRLPYSYFFDEEGYVRRQWQVLYYTSQERLREPLPDSASLIPHLRIARRLKDHVTLRLPQAGHMRARLPRSSGLAKIVI